MKQVRRLPEGPLRDYNSWHRGLADAEDTAGGGAADAIWHRMGKRRLGDLRGARIAEVGCGRGSFALEMARAGANVTAIDRSEAAVAIGIERARRAGVAVSFVCADAQCTGLRGATFDLVISFECLEHVPQPARMAGELFRILKPGGRCLLTTPSYLNGQLIAWAYSWLTGRPLNSGAGVQPHESFFLFFLVRRILERAGFVIQETDSRVFRFLLLPRVDPAHLQVVEFRHDLMNRLFRPFGLHFLFDMKRPGPVLRSTR